MYQLVGVVKGVRDNYVTVLSSSSNLTYKVYTPFFFPVFSGDIINGYCVKADVNSPGESPENSLDSYYRWIQNPMPIVEIPSTKEAIINNIISACKGPKNIPLNLAEKLYDYFQTETKHRIENYEKYQIIAEDETSIYRNKDLLEIATAEMISLYIYRYLILRKDFSLPPVLTFQANLFVKLAHWWFKHRILRRLYLLGLTNKEIRSCCFRGWPSDWSVPDNSPMALYYQLIENPYLVIDLPLNKANEIALRYGLVFSREMIEAANLTRFIHEQVSKNGWACFPLNKLPVDYSRLEQLWESLRKDYKSRIRYNSFYLWYQAQTEDLLIEFLKPQDLSKDLLSQPTPPKQITKDFPLNLPNKLSKEQKQAVRAALQNRVSIITGGAGTGKCLAPETPILCFDGSIKKAKEIVPGDLLMGDDSNPRIVISTIEGKDQIFQIIPALGRGFKCNKSHILTLKIIPWVEGTSVKFYSDGKIKTRKFNSFEEASFYAKTLEHSPANCFDLSLEEYLSKDQEFKDRTWLFHLKTEFLPFPVEKDPYQLGHEIQKGNLNRKGIPLEYKINSLGIRESLLRGLIEANGGRIFQLPDSQLKEDLEFLANSLGYAVEINKNELKILSQGDLPFRVEPVGIGDYFGFTITGNGRFLLGNFLVTHNSSIISYLAKEFDSKKISYAILSYCGKAVARLKELVKIPNCEKIMTLHLFLTSDIFHLDYVIFDEASMIPNELIAKVLFKIKNSPKLRIILVGDPNQLQPIDWGDFFNQMILAAQDKNLDSPRIPWTHLETDYRRPFYDGTLYANVRKFSDFFMKDFSSSANGLDWGEDFQFIKGQLPELIELIKQIYQVIQDHSKIVILSPHKDLNHLNLECLKIFTQEKSEFLYDDLNNLWKVGARVMITGKNFYDYNLMNGDEGIIVGISSDRKGLIINFGADRTVNIPIYSSKKQTFYSLDEEKLFTSLNKISSLFKPEGNSENLSTQFLTLSWAITVHKAQGSEWDHVIFYVPKGVRGNFFFNYKLLYTGISRAKTKIYVVADSKESFESALRVPPPYRYDNLAIRLKETLT